MMRTMFTGYWDAVGNPALVVPMGFTADGLPLSLQIAGRPFDEAGILKIGDAYQTATDWHLAVPRSPPPEPRRRSARFRHQHGGLRGAPGLTDGQRQHAHETGEQRPVDEATVDAGEAEDDDEQPGGRHAVQVARGPPADRRRLADSATSATVTAGTT